MKVILAALLSVIVYTDISYSATVTNQGNWRWRNDDGNETNATFIADQNTGFTLTNFENIRLRVEIFNDAVGHNADNFNAGIYYSSTSSDATSGTWTLITENISNDFVISPSDHFTHADPASADLLDNSAATTGTPGFMIDLGGTFVFSLTSGTNKEFEICFKATGNVEPATTYYFSARNAANLGGPLFTYFSPLPNLTTSGALPVELISFAAEATGTSVYLSWQTSNEVNNYGFEVQRSKDYKITRLQDSENNWETAAFVKGAGNSNSAKNYQYIDVNLAAGNYTYRLKQIDNDGTFSYSETIEVAIIKPADFSLAQNYPNPFNPVTSMQFAIGNKQFITLKVYDILGKETATLINEEKEQGNYKITFDASNLPGGVYFYRLTAGSYTTTKKMTLLK